MGDRFIKAEDVEAQKKKRQEEWERVRKPEDPKEAPEAPVDGRCLYDRLKEQKDKKDNESTEAKAFKNMVRGLDSEETAFLDMVDQMKAKEGRRLEAEEEELLKEVKQASESARILQPSVEDISAPTTSSAKGRKGPSRQAQLLSTVVKRKSTGSLDEEPKRAKTAQAPIGERTTAMGVIGVLPGLGDYGNSSSDSDSSDDSDEDTQPMKTYPLSMPANAPEPSCEKAKPRKSGANSSQCE